MISEEDFNVAQKSVSAAKSFLHELLGPRIDFLRDERYTKLIAKELSSKRFAACLHNYQEGLASRVSSFSSVAFPNLSLSIESEYEPLQLVHRQVFRTSFSTTRAGKQPLPTLRADNGCALILDNAGMGKSTYIKHYASILLFKNPATPVLINLRSIDFGKSLEDTLQNELGFNESAIYTELTKALLKNGKITLLLDGFDEIAYQEQSDAARKLQEFSEKYPSTPIVVTSRPQDILPRFDGADVFEFSTFSMEKTKSLLRRYDSFVARDFGLRLTAELHRVPKAFLENPLTVALMYRTFGVTGAVADKIGEFYDQLYVALFHGHDLISKKNYVREKKSELSISEFRKIFRSFSYTAVVTGKFSFPNDQTSNNTLQHARSLSPDIAFDSEKYFDDLLNAVPLIVREGVELKFIHKNIAEFFAAEYIIHSKNREKIIQDISSPEKYSRFAQVVLFVADLDSDLLGDSLLAPLATKYLKTGKNVSTIAQHALWTLSSLYPTYFAIFLDENWSEDALKFEGDDIRASTERYSESVYYPIVEKSHEISCWATSEFLLDEVRFIFFLGVARPEPELDYELASRVFSLIDKCPVVFGLDDETALMQYVSTDELFLLDGKSILELAEFEAAAQSAVTLLRTLQNISSKTMPVVLDKVKLESVVDLAGKRRSSETDLLDGVY